MHCLSIKYSIWSRIDSVDKLCLQSGVHGARQWDVRCVRGGEVQDSPWPGHMHRLRRRHVFDDYGCDSAGPMHCLSIKYSIWSRIDIIVKLCLQSGVHGARRRAVRCVRGGEVQDSPWHCRMH